MDNMSLAIIINLILAIFALSVGGAYSLKKLSKERNAYKDSLLKTKKKLREALNQANKSSLTVSAPVMDNMVEELKAEIKERERVIDALNAAQMEIEDAIKSISSDGELSSDEAKEKIASLIELNQTSSNMISTLRDQIAAGYERIQKLTDANTANHISAEGKSNKKSNELNKKLVNTLRELTSKADLTGRSLKDSKLKLQMSKKIEQQLQAKIVTLENKSGLTTDESVLGELEQEIDDLKKELERTNREKELIEKHLLNMDKSLDDVDNVEEQLTRAQLEIETLEKYVAIFDDQLDEQNDNSKIENLDDEDLDDEDVAMMSGDEAVDLISTHDSGSEDTIEDMRTLPQSRTITNVADDHDHDNDSYSIFPYVQEFYTKFINTSVTESDISVSQEDLSNWIHIGIGDGATLAVGFSKGMANYIANELFKPEGEPSGAEIKDAMGEFANVVAGGLAVDFFDGGSLAIPEHITAEDNQQIFAFTAVEKETGATKHGNSVYIGLVRSG